MSKPPGPFAGMKLTEQTALAAGPDQRLFSTPPRTPPPPQESSPSSDTEIRKAVNTESRLDGETEIRKAVKPANRKAGSPATRKAGNTGDRKVSVARATDQPVGQFDINSSVAKKETFWCAADESEALEDLKLKLRRGLDIRASKQDIIRCAIQLVAEGFEQAGEVSELVQRLRQRKVE